MKTLFRIIVGCSLWMLAAIMPVKAQIFPTRQYTTNDELANSNIYDICHDAHGYLWFATERGVSRFDGFKFTNYLFKEGLDGPIVYAVAASDSGDLYAATKFDGIYKFGNNFHLVTDASPLLSNEQVLISGNYLYSLKNGLRVAIVDLTTKKISTVTFPLEDAKPNFLCKYNGGTILIGTDKGIFIADGTGKAVAMNECPAVPVYSISLRGNSIYAGSKGVIYEITGKEVKTITFGDQAVVKRLLADKSGRIWAATFPENKLYFINGNVTTEISGKLNINGVSINKIMEDFEGNIWLATYGKGAYCIHHFYCSNFTEADGLKSEYITSLETDNKGDLFIGTYDGLYTYNGMTISGEKKFNGSLEYIRDINFHPDGKIYISVSGIQPNTLMVGNGKLAGATALYLKTSTTLEIGNTIYYSRWNRRVWRATLDGNEIKDPEVVMFDTAASWQRVNKLFMSNDKTLWVGTTKGLYMVNDDGSWVKLDTGFFNSNIAAFTGDDKNNVWVGSDRGLAKYNNGKWEIFRQIKGKNIESVTSLERDNKNRLWIGTLAGLYVWDKKSIIQFDTRNILLSDEINALEYDEVNNYLWAGTTFGLSRIDIGAFENSPVIAPTVTFRNLRTTDSIYRDLDFREELDLPYTSSNFTLRFSAIHFSAPEGIKFQYKFDDADWQQATGRQIEFASMPYGEHSILIKSLGERDVEGPVAKLVIVVATPFWATVWFKIVVGLAIAISAYLILRMRFEAVRRKQQERLELQSKISELRHQALAASMNPHFIFNALNSIQHFINVHNTEEATDYLGKFARLIRMILDSGGKTFIPLGDELERLNYYLELEKIRFGNKLTYSIQVDERLNKEFTEIPNMVIQPVVENALWHGILPAKADGTLSISFTKEEDFIRVVVDDTGIGINESRKRKKNGHNSLGIQMIRERLELLNKLSGYRAEITVTDKSDLDPAQHGTIVEIRLM